jgi:hypothetical protein
MKLFMLTNKNQMPLIGTASSKPNRNITLMIQLLTNNGDSLNVKNINL